MFWTRTYSPPGLGVPRISRLFAFALAACSLIILSGKAGYAQSVAWAPSEGTLQTGKTYEIYLSFSDCEPSADLPPDLSNNDLRLTLTGGKRQSTSIINGRSSSTIDYAYSISAKRDGQVVIPAFEITTNKGAVTVRQARFESVEPTVGNTGMKPEEVLLSRFSISDEKIYVGEIFGLDYYAGAESRFRVSGLSDPVWKPNNLVATELKPIREDRMTFDGKSYAARQYALRAIGTQPGLATQPSMEQTIQLAVGTRNNGFFPETVYDNFALSSEPFAIEILPLPAGAPDSFSGAVGSFTLESRVVPEQVQTGEPVTWTLQLSGTGNWPAGVGLPPRSVSSSFKAIQPVSKTELVDEDIFNATQTEDIVLIPTQPGSFTFGPIEFSYFNPRSERYETIQAPAKTVIVAASAALTGPVQTDPMSAGSNFDRSEDDALQLRPAGENTASRLPSIPREPIESATPRLIPTGTIELLRPTLLAVAAPIALWILFALGHAIALDPSKSRRRAFLRVKALTSETRQASSDADRRAKMRAWRQAAQQYWGVAAAEATPAEIGAAVAQRSHPELAKKWIQLWDESDRTLYGSGERALDRWSELANDAVIASPKPSRSLERFWSKSAWFGIAALACSLLPIAPIDGAESESPVQLYQGGKFGRAQQLWIQAASESPNVWEYRYNAGLAAAQRQDWASAWALWTSAYSLNPGDERIVWNLRVAQTRTDAFDPVLQDLIEKRGVYRVIGWRSAAGWERLALQLVWGAGILLCVAVASRYAAALRRFTTAAVALGLAAGLGAYFCDWAHSKYGPLAQPDTALITQQTTLRSIPSELGEEAQIEAPLGAGAVARVTRSFLDWSRIELPNGDTGWIRKESYQPLYGPPAAIR